MDDEVPELVFKELLEMLKPLIDKDLARKRALSRLDFAYWNLGQCYALHKTPSELGASQFVRDQLVRALKDALRCVRELKVHPERSN